MADDQYSLLAPLEQPAERACITQRRVVERLAAGEGIVARVLALPLAIVVNRTSFQLADVDVVEQRLLHERNAPSYERQFRGHLRAPETRVHPDLEWNSGHLGPEQPRLLLAALGKTHLQRRVAVDPVLVVERRFCMA